MTKIKYGMPQLLDIQEIERNIQLCEKLGLNFIELNNFTNKRTNFRGSNIDTNDYIPYCQS